jgi:hypothetical protein
MQSNRPLFLTVVLVLIINLVLLMRMGDLNNRIQNLSHNYNNLQSSLNSISGNVNNTLDRFTREQSWITPVHINNEKTKVENEQGLAVLNWQIKDFQEGAEVVFHYRESESGEFTAIPAESKGAGLFEVNMPLKVKVEPFWDINVSKTIDSGKNSRATAVQEAAMVPRPAQSIGYYVSMKVKDSIKSSEVSYFDLAYLAQTKYEPIRGHVAINKNKYNISLFEHYPSSNNFASVMVKFYDGNNLIADKPVEVQKTENGGKIYSLAYEAGSQSISHLVVQVEYTNGNTFEKEIY